MKIKGHLTPTEAGLAAREAHVKVLILVHMYPPCDKFDIRGAVKRHFSGRVLIGRDLMTVKI
jgi:ribonuclease BN (tRNA processing enzyme)